jgi:hypothetical protein
MMKLPYFTNADVYDIIFDNRPQIGLMIVYS